MKTFFKILGSILLLIIVYSLIAILFFDTHYHKEKTIVINAPQNKVWQQVNSMKAINDWNPWKKMDKNLAEDYKGKSGEVGDYYHWSGNDEVGEGEQKITALIPMEKVSTQMHFIRPFEDDATSDIIVKPEGNTTKVTWGIDFELETKMKPMKPMMDYQMQKSLDEGLDNLRTLLEK
ncbi:SRPBCC family protein [Chryseobacterium sp. PBS4-4]|uniref:SRPBCC family protein n=1 Tax=Chryseobacterium edaphi TaxID=2976532 RepID=A0ABT2W7N3_9FLAO|nr:SRPBCC family protein [Chryseobacterium edaphi]MCU7617984.1 SRPBCC family protein [Chryseobacterium edaphi]